MKLQLKNHKLLTPILILIAAAAVRFYYLYQSASNPTFEVPVVDSFTYDQLARSIADGKPLTGELFWQPIFYPLYLALTHVLGGSSILLAKIIQVLLGCATCLLTYFLGKRIFNKTIGIIAGLITVFYGPLIFFEGEILATSWAAFWSVLLVLLFLKTRQCKTFKLCFTLGLCGALGIITRPTFVPFFFVACVWLLVTFCREEKKLFDVMPKLSIFLVGFLTVTLPVSCLNYSTNKHFGFLPYSGGINSYVGNNPDPCKTLTARPGWEWYQITSLSTSQGASSKDPWERQAYFYNRVTDYAKNQPLNFAKNMGQKFLRFINSREIPRNVDMYVFTEWSSLLNTLVWKAGRFGFPYGFVLPFAIIGFFFYFRKLPPPLTFFILFYPAAVILVFVTARYRTPVIPIIAVLAAAGLQTVLGTLKERNWRHLVLIVVSILVIVPLSTAPGYFCEEEINYEAEVYRFVGTNIGMEGNLDGAIEYLEKSLDLDPNSAMAHGNLATAFEKNGNVGQAIIHLEKSLEVDPSFGFAHMSLGNIMLDKGKHDLAIAHYKEALKITPNDFKLHKVLADEMLIKGDLKAAAEYYIKALQLNPTLVEAHNNLADIYYKQAEVAKAVTHYSIVVRHKPDWVLVLNKLAWILATTDDSEIRNAPIAIKLATAAATRTKSEQPSILDTLAASYAAAGDYAKAIETAEKALEIAQNTNRKKMAGKIQNRLTLYRQNKPYTESPK